MTILTGRNLPKIQQPREPEPSIINEKTIVATSGGPTMFARIGVMRALSRGKPDPAITPRRKRAKSYKIVPIGRGGP
jgi:hypothetical protein